MSDDCTSSLKTKIIRVHPRPTFALGLIVSGLTFRNWRYGVVPKQLLYHFLCEYGPRLILSSLDLLILVFSSIPQLFYTIVLYLYSCCEFIGQIENQEATGAELKGDNRLVKSYQRRTWVLSISPLAVPIQINVTSRPTCNERTMISIDTIYFAFLIPCKVSGFLYSVLYGWLAGRNNLL